MEPVSGSAFAVGLVRTISALSVLSGGSVDLGEVRRGITVSLESFYPENRVPIPRIVSNLKFLSTSEGIGEDFFVRKLQHATAGDTPRKPCHCNRILREEVGHI